MILRRGWLHSGILRIFREKLNSSLFKEIVPKWYSPMLGLLHKQVGIKRCSQRRWWGCRARNLRVTFSKESWGKRNETTEVFQCSERRCWRKVTWFSTRATLKLLTRTQWETSDHRGTLFSMLMLFPKCRASRRWFRLLTRSPSWANLTPLTKRISSNFKKYQGLSSKRRTSPQEKYPWLNAKSTWVRRVELMNSTLLWEPTTTPKTYPSQFLLPAQS